MAPQNLAVLFRETALRHPDKKALFHKQNGKYRALPWKEVAAEVDAVASFLLSKGLREGDRVAILSENRPEWLITDLAALSAGAVTVPIYTSLAPSEIQYILADSGCRWIAVSDKTLFAKVAEVQKDLPVLDAF